MRTLAQALLILLLCGLLSTSHAQIGGTMLSLAQAPSAFTCVLITGNGVQLTGGGVNLCE